MQAYVWIFDAGLVEWASVYLGAELVWNAGADVVDELLDGLECVGTFLERSIPNGRPQPRDAFERDGEDHDSVRAIRIPHIDKGVIFIDIDSFLVDKSLTIEARRAIKPRCSMVIPTFRDGFGP